MNSKTEISHHLKSCFCTMCRDAEGNQHPVHVFTYSGPRCPHSKLSHVHLNQPETAANCPECGATVDDIETVDALRRKRADAVRRWKREGK